MTAQVPYEYFELSSLEPPQMQSGSSFVEPPLMPPHLFLDSQTRAAGDLTLSEPFAPPVGNHIRRRVYSQIEIKNDSRLIYIVPNNKPCTPWAKKKTPKDYILHRSALVYREFDGLNNMDIPGDSPEMLITSFKSYHADDKPADDVVLLKCPDDTYAATAKSRGMYRFEYETVSLPGASEPRSAEFFIGKNCTPSQKETADVDALLKDIVRNAPELEKISHQKNAIYELVRFFQSFTSESLNDAPDDSDVTLELVLQMLREKKGLCRHRAIIMVLAARAMGCSARIAANEIHAFVELKMDGRWYPVELGGEARSLTIQPTSPRLAAKTVSNFSFLENSGDAAQNQTEPGLIVQSNGPISLRDGTSDAMDGPRVHGMAVRFVPDGALPVMTRDVDVQFSGTFVDTVGLPLGNMEFLVELTRGERRISLNVRSDADGKSRFSVRLPADWPLGSTDVSWMVLRGLRR